MNLRIDETGMRFRISPAELEALLRGEEVANRVSFGVKAVELKIVPASSGDIALDVEEDRFILTASRFALLELRDLGKSMQGISATQGDAEISLQVDLKSAA